MPPGGTTRADPYVKVGQKPPAPTAKAGLALSTDMPLGCHCLRVQVPPAPSGSRDLPLQSKEGVHAPREGGLEDPANRSPCNREGQSNSHIRIKSSRT